MHLISILVALIQLIITPVSSDTPAPERVNLKTTIDEQEYTCAIVINEAAIKGGPAILFLHGYGESGTDNDKQLTVGLPTHMDNDPERWPYVLIAPQKPIFNSEWEDHEQAVLDFLDQAIEKGLIDPDRVAITGLSQRGHATIIFAKDHPDRFVAAAPVCGYLRPIFNEPRQRINHPKADAELPEFNQAALQLKDMPIWFWHGEIDSIVPVEESRAMHEALLAIDANTNYTELPAVDHDAWDPAYSSEELADWFKSYLIDDE